MIDWEFNCDSDAQIAVIIDMKQQVLKRLSEGSRFMQGTGMQGTGKQTEVNKLFGMLKRTMIGTVVSVGVVFSAGCQRLEELLPSVVDVPPEVVAEAVEPEASGPIGPALWKTGDADTTIYLFGTVHVLPKGLDWRVAAIDRAMAEAATIYFETDVRPNQAEMMQLISSLGVYERGDTITSRLTPEQAVTLEAACGELKVPLQSINAMKPWLAASTLAEKMTARAGYDAASGVERTLEPIARGANMEIRKFETVEQQLRVFADLPEEVQINYLMGGLDDLSEESDLLNELVDAWVTGDVDRLEQIMIREEMGKTPEIYHALLVKRNQNWVETLSRLTADETGTFFVAVGAAHLVGDDSVVDLLADVGIDSERVN